MGYCHKYINVIPRIKIYFGKVPLAVLDFIINFYLIYIVYVIYIMLCYEWIIFNNFYIATDIIFSILESHYMYYPKKLISIV